MKNLKIRQSENLLQKGVYESEEAVIIIFSRMMIERLSCSCYGVCSVRARIRYGPRTSAVHTGCALAGSHQGTHYGPHDSKSVLTVFLTDRLFKNSGNLNQISVKFQIFSQISATLQCL